ncbi:hypothetical protein E2C01_053126 [Portunus trituberculatus]|uniref:Zonadhesin n=1 Tax=Portunus trituberculatus TaxID=210409 RepID=A0A5B7GG93_PORTR|nr:hypothetical protein [Portunus trituberculatus]
MRFALCRSLLPLLLVQLAAARYYKPRPLVCPVTQEVEIVDETLEAKQLEVVTTPFVLSQVQLNTVYQTRPVVVTQVTLVTVTAKPLQLDLTEVQLVLETLPLTAVKVNTVTREVVDTNVNLLTRTATNYVSQFQTLTAIKTHHVTSTTQQTVVLHTTHKVVHTSVSSVTVTEAALTTDLVVSTLPRTVVVATETKLEPRTVFYTHSLTKMITSTICLASTHY